MNTVIIAIVMGIMYWWCRGMILSYFAELQSEVLVCKIKFLGADFG